MVITLCAERTQTNVLLACQCLCCAETPRKYLLTGDYKQMKWMTSCYSGTCRGMGYKTASEQTIYEAGKMGKCKDMTDQIVMAR